MHEEAKQASWHMLFQHPCALAITCMITGGRHATRRSDRHAECVRACVCGWLQGRCYGCGCLLQCTDNMGLGYVKADKYETKKKHKQLDKVGLSVS